MPDVILGLVSFSGASSSNSILESTDSSSIYNVLTDIYGATIYGQPICTLNYVTYTGKTVQATVYVWGSWEYWVNDDVPFGLVKSVFNGQTAMELYDFGNSGAKRDISKTEMENAQDIENIDIEIDF